MTLRLEPADLLAKRLEAHAQSFDSLLNLIPHQFYFPKKSDSQKNKWLPKKEKKELDEKYKVKAAKAKRVKLDPHRAKHTAKILCERDSDADSSDDSDDSENQYGSDETPSEGGSDIDLGSGNDAEMGEGGGSDSDGSDNDDSEGESGSGDDSEGGSDDDSEGGELEHSMEGLADSDADDDESGDDRDDPRAKRKTPKSSNGSGAPASSIAELHERLKAKLELYRQNREPKQRPEHIATARAKRKDSVRAKKTKRREEKKEKAKAKEEKSGPTGVGVMPAAFSQSGKINKDSDRNPSTKRKHDDAEEGDFSFSRVISSGDNMAPGKKQDKRALLKKAEKEKEKLDALKGTVEGAELSKQKGLDAALKRAAGQKVKDDPALLKKSLKREEKLKLRSTKKWVERSKKQKEEQDKRIKKREANLQKRKDAKTGGKKKKGAASPGKKGGNSGKNRPGFEGRKKGFLNKERSSKPGGK